MMPAAGYRIVFETRGAQLRAEVSGSDGSLSTTEAYWEAIRDEVLRGEYDSLLLIDLLGGAPLVAQDWKVLVDRLRETPLARLNIAHVKPEGLQQIEFCEIFAREAGMRARVFEDEGIADRWLRYG